MRAKLVLFHVCRSICLGVIQSLRRDFFSQVQDGCPQVTSLLDPRVTNPIADYLVLLVDMVPLIALYGDWLIRRVMKAKSRPVIGVGWPRLLWMGGLVSVGLLTSRVAHKFSVEYSSEEKAQIAPVSVDKMYVEMLPYGDDYAELMARDLSWL